jgi:hypothetical protein
MPIRRVGEGFIDVIVPSLSKMLCLAPEKLAAVEFFTALPAALHFQSLKLESLRTRKYKQKRSKDKRTGKNHCA